MVLKGPGQMNKVEKGLHPEGRTSQAAKKRALPEELRHTRVFLFFGTCNKLTKGSGHKCPTIEDIREFL